MNFKSTAEGCNDESHRSSPHYSEISSICYNLYVEQVSDKLSGSLNDFRYTPNKIVDLAKDHDIFANMKEEFIPILNIISSKKNSKNNRGNLLQKELLADINLIRVK